MANIKKIKLPNGTEYDIKDSGALPLMGGTVTGPVIFEDSTSMNEATIGDLVTNGNASFTNNIQANTINGVAVGSSPKFTDTITTATTTGSGNAVTAISASNGALTVTKGTTFLTSHQDISGKADKSATVSNVAYDSTNAKITKTINGTTSDVVTVATLKTALGSMPASDVYSWAKASSKPTYTASEVGALASNTTYVSTITTTAGAHTAISSKSGAVSFNVPTTAAHVGAATSDHVHGNITNGGDITTTAPTIANGDQIVINDASASKITNGPTFDGSTTTKALTPKGTWETFLKSYTESDPVFSASAAAGITSSDITNWNGKTSNTGTVTKVTAGTGLKIGTASSGGDITTSGTINHINSVTAQTTQAVYPIKIDAQGHISAYGTAVTIVNTRGTAASGGTTLSVVNTGDMYTWNNKQDKATTLAGYGITDAKISNGTITLGSNTITPLTSETYTGTVTSVRVQATSPVQSSTSTAQSTSLNTTISLANAYGDTKNPYGTKTANYVLAGPTSGSAAAPTFRALVAADIPSGFVQSSTTAKIFVQSSTPTGMAAGDIWIDTTGL